MSTSLNKLLGSTATAAVVAAAIVPAASANTTETAAKQHSFKDVSKNYNEAVSFLYGNDILKGKSNEMFGTYTNLTRGDAAVILAGALGLDTEAAEDAGFADVNKRIEGSVNALAELGIIATNTDKFNPDQPLSRGAMAKLLVLGFDLEGYEVETPFEDLSDSFGPYVEALYGTEITSGKTATTYGTTLNITRGEFANLLYKTIRFVDENFIPYAESVTFKNSTTFEIKFEEAIQEKFTAQDVAEVTPLGIRFDNGEVLLPQPTQFELSADRTTMTVTYDLTGKAGVIAVDDVEQAFDFKAPVAGTGSVTLEGIEAPVTFNFAGTNAASVVLPSTQGVANLNAMTMDVVDNYAPNSIVTVILKETDVESVKPGEGAPWGQLEYKDGKWVLIDYPAYDMIPDGHYKLEAQFKDVSENATTLTLDITVGNVSASN